MSLPLSTNRLEAFSDGVIAVIITIMVLELKVPDLRTSNLQGIQALMPLLLVYLLSFVQTGIYWVNHHYLIDDVEFVTHGMLWANLAFLFFLSLIPFATTWVGARGISSFAIALYAVTCALPAVAWTILSTVILKNTGIAQVGSPVKQASSAALYLGAVPLSYISPYVGLAMVFIVAILWLMPPRRIVEQVKAIKKESAHSHSR